MTEETNGAAEAAKSSLAGLLIGGGEMLPACIFQSGKEDGEHKSPILEAVNKVSLIVGKLDYTATARTGKDGKGSYEYTSIDDFLDAVREPMAKNGLVLNMSAEAHRVAQRGPSVMLSVKFLMQLLHTSGEALPASCIYVDVYYGGAQSFGSTRSYAIKQYYRGVFSIATGDNDDPDAHAGKPSSEPPPREPEEDPPTPEELTGAIEAIEAASSFEELGKAYKALPKRLRTARSILDRTAIAGAEFLITGAASVADLDRDAERIARGVAANPKLAKRLEAKRAALEDGEVDKPAEQVDKPAKKAEKPAKKVDSDGGAKPPSRNKIKAVCAQLSACVDKGQLRTIISSLAKPILDDPGVDALILSLGKTLPDDADDDAPEEDGGELKREQDEHSQAPADDGGMGTF